MWEFNDNEEEIKKEAKFVDKEVNCFNNFLKDRSQRYSTLAQTGIVFTSIAINILTKCIEILEAMRKRTLTRTEVNYFFDSIKERVLESVQERDSTGIRKRMHEKGD